MRLALAEYGVRVDLIEETPWDPSHDIFELNPAGTLPVYLEDPHIAGVAASRRSASISRRPSPPASSLIPGDVFARAEVRRLVGWFDAKFYAEVSEPC